MMIGMLLFYSAIAWALMTFNDFGLISAVCTCVAIFVGLNVLACVADPGLD